MVAASQSRIKFAATDTIPNLVESELDLLSGIKAPSARAPAPPADGASASAAAATAQESESLVEKKAVHHHFKKHKHHKHKHEQSAGASLLQQSKVGTGSTSGTKASSSS